MRPLAVVLGVVLVVGAIAGVKACQIGTLIKTGKAMQAAGPPPEAVSVATARNEAWEATLSAIGTVTAVKGVTVSNEVAGVVTAIHFDSGDAVKEGAVLVELDTSVERAQLASAQARQDLAQLNAGRSKALVDTNAIPRSQLDTDQSLVESSNADRGALAAQIGRKLVRAPFGGRLGIRNVNLGQYLAPGTAITVLETAGALYADFTLPEQRLPDLKVGMPVRVRAEAAGRASFDGEISAMDPSTDASTHTLKLRAKIPNPEGKLRPGMFASVAVILPQRASSVVVPLTAVVHAAYGDSVFVVEPKKDAAGQPAPGADGKPASVARQQFVRTGAARGDFVSLLDGVHAGEQVVSVGAFKLRNGASVAVHDDVPQQPQLDPHPENR